jgi:hypothetical protein
MPYIAEMSIVRQEWVSKRPEQCKNKAIEGRNDAVAGLVQQKDGKGL